VSNQVVVHFKDGALTSCRDSTVAMVGGTVIDVLPVINYYVIQLPDTAVIAAVATIGTSYCVDDVSPNGVASDATLFTPNDYHYPDLDYLHNTGQNGGTPGADIHAEEGWNFIREAP
jgi:hypothetical protein